MNHFLWQIGNEIPEEIVIIRTVSSAVPVIPDEGIDGVPSARMRHMSSFKWVAVNRSNFSVRKDRGRTFRSNRRDRMECGRILSYLLYGSVASLPSPSSNIEAWPYGTSLCFASLLHSGH